MEEWGKKVGRRYEQRSQPVQKTTVASPGEGVVVAVLNRLEAVVDVFWGSSLEVAECEPCERKRAPRAQMPVRAHAGGWRLSGAPLVWGPPWLQRFFPVTHPSRPSTRGRVKRTKSYFVWHKYFVLVRESLAVTLINTPDS